VRPFVLVALAAFCFTSAGAAQVGPPATAPAVKPPPANAPKQPAANNPKPKPKPKPATGLYLRGICRLQPEHAGNVGECLTIGAAAPTPLPAVIPGIPAPDSCPIDGQSPNAVRSLSAASVKTQLGTIPDPFQLQVTGNYLYLYSTDDPLSLSERTHELPGLIVAISDIAAAQSGYVFELDVPHASTLGSSVAASLQAIAPSGITVATTGTTTVRVTADGTISCDGLKAFVRDFDRFVNHTHPEAPVASVFFIDPAGSGAALGATAIPYAVSGNAAATPPQREVLRQQPHRAPAPRLQAAAPAALLVVQAGRPSPLPPRPPLPPALTPAPLRRRRQAAYRPPGR
jgi:hypothetical protein